MGKPRTAPAQPVEVTIAAGSSPALPQAAESPAELPAAAPASQDRALPDHVGPGVEAILLTADRPVTAARLAEALGLGESGVGRVRAVIDGLNRDYEATGRAFRIEAVAGGYRAMTVPALAPVLAAFGSARSAERLSRAAIETLAIIAYRQPITRASLEAIRGVSCGEVLRSLVERRMITVAGRAEELGRPMLYGTTREFLGAFGLATIKDLPTVSDLAWSGG